MFCNFFFLGTKCVISAKAKEFQKKKKKKGKKEEENFG